ncbi:MAG TPA: hypothetical protein VFJ62_11310 [Usitatibacter sp.]|jgi:hypothetical protein|nr:hypothetical protein [Usitatibacter sp.]HWH42225.1 hypothetical protein [Usitatibacter sp.]
MKDFELAVIGPIPARRMGVASGCSECRESQDRTHRCTGFGAGCLGLRNPPRREDPERR